ncbi:MAG: M23 family metallopeptidase [Cyanobacteria bacterium P01_H01_bin.74]
MHSVAWTERLAFAPVKGKLTSGFGWRSDPFTKRQKFHSGIDIAAPQGQSVFAPQSGFVMFSGQHGGYGNVVVLGHGNQLFTLYGHNQEILVQQGQQVFAGQPIARVGRSGNATGPHLHFEVHFRKQYVDPKVYLKALEKQVLSKRATYIRP